MRLPILAAVSFAVSGAAAFAALSLPQSPSPSSTAASAAIHRAPRLPKPPAPATSIAPVLFDASSLGSPLLLDKNWRVGISADPSVAHRDFDDLAWAVRDAKAYMADVPEEEIIAPLPTQPSNSISPPLPKPANAPSRYVWFRLHINLAPNHGPLALLIELPVSLNASLVLNSPTVTPDVFVNGNRIQPLGPHASDPQDYQPISRVYLLDVPPSETSLTLVLRTIYIPFGYGAYNSFFASRTLSLGNPADLERELALWSNRSLDERLPRLFYSAVLVVLAIFLFALYFAQKGHTEYLWLALHELVQAPIGFVELAGSSAHLDSLWYGAISLELALVAGYFFFEFLVAFLAARRRWYIKALRYTSPLLALAGPIILFVGHVGAGVALLVVVLLCALLWFIAWMIFVFGTLIVASIKRNFEAGLLLIPLLLSAIGLGEPIMTSIASENTSKPFVSPLTIQAGPIPIHFASVADFTGILAIVLIIFFRFLRVQRDRERATNELAAARTVQELLIPQEKLATPGFEVDSVYNPATEVGGDFFYLSPDGPDGMTVVIGDVAGKGLKAAMNVSLLMGALRRTHERSPAAILQSLNRVLSGAESFTTCLAVWLGSNGEMVVANAGHLPPFLNSQEIALPGSLPLGVVSDPGVYEEIHLYLHPGDRVLLLSDGVVEARQPSGELFGFDRVRNFSSQSAFYIAEAAKSFGQQDDITVLTIRRLAQALAA